MKLGSSVTLKNPNSPSSLLTELQHSEARFKAMFETSAVGIGIMGLDRKIIDANPAMCQMLGISHEEIIGQSPKVATYPEDYIQSTSEWEELLTGKRDYFWSERRYMRKNGEIFWTHITMSVVRDADGKPLYMVGMVIDIDERKRAVIELRESEKRFRATFESSAIGIGILSLDGKIMQVNSAVCAMSGYSETELQQRYDSQNVYPEDLNVGAELFEELLTGKRDSYNVEKRYVRKNGEVFWVLLTLSAVRDDAGNPIYLVGLIEDIDEQKRTLAELQESEARFRAIYDHAEMGIVIANLDENTASNLDDDLFRALLANQRFNPALQRMFGYSETELGVARYVTNPDKKSCEFALVVADQWQRQGIGHRLMHQLMEIARDRGLERMEGEVLSNNFKMLDLMKSLNFHITTSPEDNSIKQVVVDL